MAYAFFLIIAFSWGINFLLMKQAVTVFTPTTVATIRVVTATLFLSGFIIWKNRQWPFSRRDIPAVMVVVLVGYAWPFIIQPYLIPYCGSGMIGIMPSLVPLLTIVISIPLLRNYPSRRQVAGVILGLFFTIVLFYDAIYQDLRESHLLIALTVPVCYAFSNTLIRRSFLHISPLLLTFVCLAGTSGLLIPLAWANPLQENADLFASYWPIVSALALGIFGTGIALVLFTHLIQTRGPLFAGMVTYLIPIVALVAGGFDGEPISTLRILALAGILSMVVLVQWPTKPVVPHKTPPSR